MRPRSSFTRLRPKALQGYRVDNAFPPMDFCTHLGVVADGKVAEDIIGRVRRRGDMERYVMLGVVAAVGRATGGGEVAQSISLQEWMTVQEHEVPH